MSGMPPKNPPVSWYENRIADLKAQLVEKERKKMDWGYLTIIAVYLAAAIGYAWHDGSDPWTAAFSVSMLILLGKGWVWCFGS